ncbi:hypothetical protein AMS68_003878 [Peltaster fructicola]|uniref:LicD/FKTN/FKRP nucleotidyltransferase domain-containing protein n=1 Tax=Peltaster fructicola TaxID=286661 RepID=A0A6H0XUL4_9PEZI|nr:hypothetical protein AMS68_003878 [Peltaster fructicola]
MSGKGGAASGNKLKMTLGLPVGAVMNCADNSGARNLYVISVKGFGARLNRLPAAGVGDMVMATVKKGKPELRKKVMPAVIVRQSKPWRRADGIFLYFEDNAGVIVNPKGEMKGSAITGPVGKEAAELWPRIASNSGVVITTIMISRLLSILFLVGTITNSVCARPSRYNNARARGSKNLNTKTPDSPEKYFHEAAFDIHYDGRFTDGRLPYEHHRSSLILLAQTCLTTLNEIGVETWIMHGSLVGWYWNRRILPWDSDIDLQISERSIEHLAQYYNMSTHHFRIGDSSLRRNYLLEINPNFRNSSITDRENMIDARWIDTDTGLFLDLTTLRHNTSAAAEGTDGAMACKDGHHYRYDDIYPLRETTFEGVPAKVPFAYTDVITEEYRIGALSNKFFMGHQFDDAKQEWVPMGNTNQQSINTKDLSSFVPKLEQAARELSDDTKLLKVHANG